MITGRIWKKWKNCIMNFQRDKDNVYELIPSLKGWFQSKPGSEDSATDNI